MENKSIIPLRQPPTRRVTITRHITAAAAHSNHHHARHAGIDAYKRNIMAGSMAGVTSTSLFYPLDVLRTKMQSSGKKRTPLREFFTKTIRRGGGLQVLYTGLSLPLSAQAVYKATLFTVNGASKTHLLEYKRQVHGKDYQLSLQDEFMCGALGGAVNAALFVTPVEFVRNQLIAQQPRTVASGPIQVVKRTLYEQGIAGLWRGAAVTVTRDALGWGFSFYVYHSCRAHLESKYRDAVDPNAITIVSGAITGISFWLVALPLDTAKTLVQNGSAPSARVALQESLRARGPWRTMLRFCRGWQFAFGKGAPAAAVTLSTFDVCSRTISEYRWIE